MTLKRTGLFGLAVLLGLQLCMPLQAKEFNVECSSFDDCMAKGDQLAKKRKLSLSLEAYRNAIKFDTENKDAWRKFEKIHWTGITCRSPSNHISDSEKGLHDAALFLRGALAAK